MLTDARTAKMLDLEGDADAKSGRSSSRSSGMVRASSVPHLPSLMESSTTMLAPRQTVNLTSSLNKKCYVKVTEDSLFKSWAIDPDYHMSRSMVKKHSAANQNLRTFKGNAYLNSF